MCGERPAGKFKLVENRVQRVVVNLRARGQQRTSIEMFDVRTERCKRRANAQADN